MSELAKNHDRIWLAPRCNIDEREWCDVPQHCDDCGEHAVEYIRADVARAQIIEECAKLAASHSARDWSAEGMRREITAAIRALIPAAPEKEADSK